MFIGKSAVIVTYTLRRFERRVIVSSKRKTYKQVEAAQAKAVRFAENVLDDPDLANDLENLTPEEYAEKKHWEINESNPCRMTGERYALIHKSNFSGKEVQSMPTKDQLMERIRELEDENDDLNERLDAVYGIVSDDEEEGDDDDDEE